MAATGTGGGQDVPGDDRPGDDAPGNDAPGDDRPDRLHQIRVQYDTGEDRLLLRLATVQRREFRIWITRRVLISLWPVLMKALEAQVGSEAAASGTVARRAVMAMQSEAAAQGADFATRYQEADLDPVLGTEPLLPVRLQWAHKADGGVSLVFHDKAGRVVPINLGGLLVHNLVRLVARVAERAQWGLDLALPSPDLPETTGGALH
ncbi:MAG: hypothetical protein RLO50_06900 [Azospirillaceae bacterium]